MCRFGMQRGSIVLQFADGKQWGNGASGTTSALKPGDVVEVEIEGVGLLRNPVVADAEGEREGG